MHEVTQKVFPLVGNAARVVIGLPKQILLANDVEFKVITPRGQDILQQAKPCHARIDWLDYPAIITDSLFPAAY